MMMITGLLQIVCAAVMSSLAADSFGERDIAGCTAPFLLPDKPFVVIWNHPTSGCAAKGVNLNFKKWGIVDNSKDSFIGEQIALLYSLGQFPLFSGSTAINGGIPQLGNLTYHLQKVKGDITTEIYSLSFSGLGVIDFEAWRPILWLNYDSLKIYKQKSVELAKEKFPSYNSSQLFEEATREFDTAARKFMETTLKTASLLRPGGKWGFYGYPRCWDPNCKTKTVKINDMISWVYNSSTGIYPSIYFDNDLPTNVTAMAVKNIIYETLRVRALWSRQDTTILPYSLIQANAYDFFSLSALSNSVVEPADMGASGVVLWGSSSYMQAKNECLALQGYINSTLGPLSLNIMNFFANCSQRLCQGHGRCVSKNYEKISQRYLQKGGGSGCSLPASSLMRKKRQVRMVSHQSVSSNTTPHKDGIYKLATDNSSLHRSSKRLYFLTGFAKKPLYDFDKKPLYDFDKKPLYDFDKKPLYDFDNYVCRCFTGWSGAHCEQK